MINVKVLEKIEKCFNYSGSNVIILCKICYFAKKEITCQH